MTVNSFTSANLLTKHALALHPQIQLIAPLLVRVIFEGLVVCVGSLRGIIGSCFWHRLACMNRGWYGNWGSIWRLGTFKTLTNLRQIHNFRKTNTGEENRTFSFCVVLESLCSIWIASDLANKCHLMLLAVKYSYDH